MGTHETKSKLKSPRKERGFSLLQVVIVIAIIALVTSVGVMGITRARASIRLSRAAREYASYIEKARVTSIRKHPDTLDQMASVTINPDLTSYVIFMDLDGDGTLEQRTINLPDGVEFVTAETIAFDWRGRTWNTLNGVTSSNAQVSITLKNSADSILVDVTGSGDVTIDSGVFDDEVPNVNVNVGDLASGSTPGPSPSEIPTPHPLESPTPDPIESPTPDPKLDPTPEPTPTPEPKPEESATPTPTPTPTPRVEVTPTPTPTPTPSLCNISISKSEVTLAQDGTTTVQLSQDSLLSLSITAVSSSPSNLQVTPGATLVLAGGKLTFTIKAKRAAGTYTVTFTSTCGVKILQVTVE